MSAHLSIGLRVLSSCLALGAFAAQAHAQADLDVEFACPGTIDAADRARPGVPQAVPLTYPAGFGCAIFYGNASAAPLDVEFTVSFPIRDITLWRDPAVLDTDADPTNASELPDGVLRPFGLGRGNDWRARFLHHIHPVVGFQAFDPPGFDHDQQRLRYTVSVAAGQTTSLQFATTENYHFTDFNTHFPRGDYEIVLTAKVGGVDVMHDGAPATWIVPVSVLSPGVPQTAVFPTNGSARVEADGNLTGYVAAGLATHVNYTTARFPVQTSAFVTVHLPYWNGSAFVADGGYDPLDLDHLPALDLDELYASLVRRRNAGYGFAGPALEEVVLADAFDAPASGPNAGKLVRFDPDTLTLYGTFGALGLNNGTYRTNPPVPDAGSEVLDRLALRYAAPFATEVMALLDDGDIVPLSSCYESEQTASTCLPGRYTIGSEPWRAPTYFVGLFNGANAGESAPVGPGSSAQVVADCLNASGRTRDVDFVLQMPADIDGDPAIDLTSIDINALHAWGPAAAQRYEIWLSTHPADYGSPSNTSLRTVPTATTSDWILCKARDATAIAFAATEETTLQCTRADVIALGLDPLALQEVRFRFIGQKPQALSVTDAVRGCSIGIFGAATADMPNSIDETCSGGTDSFDPFALTNVQGLGGTSSFASVGRFYSTYDDLSTGVETAGGNAEFASRAIVSACMGSGGVACYYTIENAQIGQVRRLYGALYNGGSAPMRTPLEYCATLPVGFRPYNLDDPEWGGQRLIFPSGARVPLAIRDLLLPDGRYSVDYDPVTRRVCVALPESGDPGDPYDSLFDALQIELWGEIVPGAERTMRLQEPTWSWREDTVCAAGVPKSLATPFAGGFDLGLTPDINLATTSEPTIIPGGGEFCVETSIDNRAYDDAGNIIQTNAGSARDSVVYFSVPDGAGTSAVLVSASSPGADVWVTTQDLVEADLDAGNALDPAHLDPSTGFVLCASDGAACDAAALGALGIAAGDATWIGIGLGELLVTDAAPRGVGPFNGAAPVNNPYIATICLADDGSTAGTSITSEVVFRSNDATSATASPSVIVTSPCPDGATWSPEVCDGVDNDCDSETDEGFVPEPVACGSDTCLNATTGMTTCEDGVLGDDCDEVYATIGALAGFDDDLCLGSEPAGDLIVVYLIVQDATTGQDAGTVRCWRDVGTSPATACDTVTEATGEVVLKVYPELLCLAPEGGTP